jgi:hypothetical protein
VEVVAILVTLPRLILVHGATTGLTRPGLTRTLPLALLPLPARAAALSTAAWTLRNGYRWHQGENCGKKQNSISHDSSVKEGGENIRSRHASERPGGWRDRANKNLRRGKCHAGFAGAANS